jgi:hypothetical protein
MAGRYRLWVWLVTIVLLALVVLGTRDAASAQEATSTSTVAPISTEVPDGGADEGEAAVDQQTALSGVAKAWLVGGVLLLALVTVAMHYYFLSQSRRDYFRAASLLFQQGVFPRPVPIPAQGGAPGGVLGAERMEGDDTATGLVVIGPATLMRGQEGVYVALINGMRADDASWSVAPADAATVTPGPNAVTSVSAARVGTLALTASLPGQQGATATQTIAVQPEATPDHDATAPELPFLGQGFASLVGAVVLIAAVVVLAAIGVEDWAVIGTIFGALAGYLFGTVTK